MNCRFLRLLGLIAAMAHGSPGTESPQADSHPVFPNEVRLETGVAYLSESRKEQADLCFPKERSKGSKLPAVLIIQGGGWDGGRRFYVNSFVRPGMQTG